MATMQHHDAVTGTEKQHVAEDYAMRMTEGTLHIDTLILPAIILKIVSLQDWSIRAVWAGHWLLGRLKEP